jgi:hypothetical protein
VAVCGLIDESAKPGDRVLVFQKDAYMALRKPDARAYDVSLLQRAEIVSEYIRGSVELVCVPPTKAAPRPTVATLSRLEIEEMALAKESDLASVARLVCAPPGYVGYDQGGQPPVAPEPSPSPAPDPGPATTHGT